MDSFEKKTDCIPSSGWSSEELCDDVGRTYWFLENLDNKEHYDAEDLKKLEGQIDNENRQPAPKVQANLISSQCQDGYHRPVLDFDIAARYVSSSTAGHGHLYIDKALTWEQYEKLLTVLGEVGILEPGFVGAAIRRRATFIRPAWVSKPGSRDTVTKL